MRPSIAVSALVAVAWAAVAVAQVAQPASRNTIPFRRSAPENRPQGASPAPQVTSGNVSHQAGAQSETHIAVDPTNPDHLLAASNDLSGAGTMNGYESLDGGLTWTPFNVEPGQFTFDPWVTFDHLGNAYIAYGRNTLDLWVAVKLAGVPGITYRDVPDQGGDRYAIAADIDAASPFLGRVYAGYDNNTLFGTQTARVAFSDDQGATWTESVAINDQGEGVIGINPVVGPGGILYVAWLDYPNRRIWVDRSTDGGVTWGADSRVTDLRLNTPVFFIAIPPQPDRGILPFPFLAVAPAGSPSAERLYIVYDDKDPATADTNAYLRYSDDGGTTWTPERALNDDANHAYQFHPAIAMNGDGVVAVSFYDTRFHPSNQRAIRGFALSRDGGATWEPNRGLASKASNESGPGDPNDYGDYQGMAITSTNLFPVWTDSRAGNLTEDVYVARLP